MVGFGGDIIDIVHGILLYMKHSSPDVQSGVAPSLAAAEGMSVVDGFRAAVAGLQAEGVSTQIRYPLGDVEPIAKTR